MAAWAHSLNLAGERHGLIEHLYAVANLAANFAEPFGARDLAYAAGLYHDLGKFHPDFQKYLQWSEEHPGERRNGGDHKGAGAKLVADVNPVLPLLVIAHHGGLRLQPSHVKAWFLEERISSRLNAAVEIARREVPQINLNKPVPLPTHITNPADWELYWRMLFSCLVDADFLDTERHFSSERFLARETTFDSRVLIAALRERRAQLRGGRSDSLTALRAEIAAACEAAGAQPTGLYRMTVPTGGGKTLAGMAFALNHAMHRGKRRVIVAVPYTSITEQNAQVYREVFGRENVLEHHSAAKPDETDHGELDAAHSWERLAAENWDAPVVVTTTVQLFESLLGHRTSTTRKLHRISNSVVILDEVQMLPTQYLDTILDVLRCLVEHFNTTILLSTATQPDYTYAGFRDIPEIAPDPTRTFAAVKRVRYHFDSEPWSWQDCAARMSAERQAMMVLNTKKDALSVLHHLGGDALHLSTNLCGAHRRKVLDEVKLRLKADEPCLLVSTQVVEAGVDLDFPAVFRAMGPLDRIIQAAGRCNREGKLAEGRVTVFRPAEGGVPLGSYKTGTQLSEKHVRQHADLASPDVATRYFDDLYRTVSTDLHGIQALRERMNYPDVSRNFRMIRDGTEDVVVPYSDADAASLREAMDQLRHDRGSARTLMRSLQPYTVGLRRPDIDRARARRFVDPVIDGVWEWIGPSELYDDVRGLIADGADEELLIG